MTETNFDDFDSSIQCEDICGQEPDFIPDEDDDLMLDEPDDGLLPDDEDDLLMDEQDHWFTDDGGLTADAYEWLADRDKENGFC